MAVALGLTSATEPFPGTSLLSSSLRGNVGLIFSPRPPTGIISYFASFTPSDYARAGTTASRTFSIPPGVVYSRAGEIPEEEDVPIAHSVEPSLRKLGVPTTLVKGKVMLESEEPFIVCTEGQKLGSAQTSLLKMFGVTMAEFKVGVEAWWERETGEVTFLENGIERKGKPSQGNLTDADADADVGANESFSEEVA